MKILVINSGSSSIKFQLFKMSNNASLANGLVEQIGEKMAHAEIRFHDDSGHEFQITEDQTIKNHKEGLEVVNSLLIESGIIKDLTCLDGIGHRVVHGGAHLSKPIIIDDQVISEIRRLIPLAPLHNAAHLDGILSSLEQCPNVPQVVVFDTAFHSTMPQHAFMYALPYDLYEEHQVRKYGFHGTSHHYVAKEASKFLNLDYDKMNAISLHLGNGASACAIKEGKSVDTSMGLTPLEGLVMGTRSGDMDPAILPYLAKMKDMDIHDLDTMLNKESGLKGICGNNDMRIVGEMAKTGDEKAELAIKMFTYRVKKYIGAYLAILGNLDCLIFTGGIGENDIDVRRRSCLGLEHLGIIIDNDLNNQYAKGPIEISAKESAIKVVAIPTNEELEIAAQVKALI
ncbi:acetate/propionate family kinase [Sulfurospirillum sp. 1612]|uniref:acetate/propionate family kinase n=1 Tax=Sulfurospirillum sp. 1612 TaxID=3094835 RepID=UPI002F934A13